MVSPCFKQGTDILELRPHPVTVTFWTFELVAGETGGAFHQPQREENTTT